MIDVALSLLVLFLAPASQDTIVEEGARRLEDELPALLGRADVPGCSVALAGASGVRWTGAFGVRSETDAAEVDAATVFEAASLSKPVFAYCVLQLVDEGVLELDVPLSTYAELDDVAHDARHARLTARQLLSHSGGLPNWRPPGGTLEFVADPGTGWTYSGEGFVLLQRVVEELTGATLQELATDLVFEPLGMARSSFVWRDDLAANRAVPHDEAGTPRAPQRIADGNAAFSLLTTAPDYARFLVALLRGERLSPDTRAALFTSQVDVGPGVTWGLGIGLERNPDGLAAWHWGHNGGYRAYTVVYPARDLALVYFSNGDTGMRLVPELVELATGEVDHPALRHLDYDAYDAPRHVVLRELRATLAANDVGATIDRAFALLEEQPPGSVPASVPCILAYELLGLERSADAVEVLRVTTELYPEAAVAHTALGDALHAAGDDAGAKASWQRALELAPKDAVLRARLTALGD